MGCLNWKIIRYLVVIIASLHVVSAIKINLEDIGTLWLSYGALVTRNFVDLVFSNKSNPFKGLVIKHGYVNFCLRTVDQF